MNKSNNFLIEIEEYLKNNPEITRTELEAKKRSYYDYLNKNKLMDNYISPQRKKLSKEFIYEFNEEIYKELQKFINDNKIQCLSDFMKNYPKECKKGKLNGICTKLIFPIKRNNWKDFITDSIDVQKIINYFEIKNPFDLKQSFGEGLYQAIIKNPNCKNKIKYPNRIIGKYEGITLDYIQKLIDKKGYKTAKDFRAAERGLYSYASTQKNWLSQLRYKKMLNSWSHLNTIDDFNKFIKDNNIYNSAELRERFPGVGIRVTRKKFDRFLKYCKNTSGFRSKWEKELFDLINNDKDFSKLERNVSFKECKIINPLPFDLVFYLSKNPNIRIIIEIQGPTHFTNLYGDKRLIETRKSDIVKHRWANKMSNTFLFYYTNPQKIRCYNFNKKYSYPYYVYTSIKELLNDIKKLI